MTTTTPWDAREFARRDKHLKLFAETEKLAKAQAKAFKISARDVVSYAVAQFVKRAQELTIRTVGRPPGRGTAASVQAAKKDYNEYLRLRIKGVRFRKWGDLPGEGRGMSRRQRARAVFMNRLSKKEASPYLARAKALMGRFAAGWNAAAFAKKLTVPQFVRRHGAIGKNLKVMTSGSLYSETICFDASGKGAGHGNIGFVVETALGSVKKELASAQTKFLAANVRKHMRKLAK